MANHALVDGNKRLGLSAVVVLLGVNGGRLELTNDQAYEHVMAIADGSLRDVADIAARLPTTDRP